MPAFARSHPTNAGIWPLVAAHTQLSLPQGFKADFLWPGTADWTAWAAVPTALAVQRTWGFGNMRRYNHGLLRSALHLLGKAFAVPAVLGAPCPIAGVGGGLVLSPAP